jgi:hypothetical protein
MGLGPLIQLGAALLAFAVVLFAPQVLNDGDTYWHLASGQWMLAHGQILHRDVFSFSHLGRPWDTHEWLSDVLMGLAFRGAGWSGLLILYASAAAAAAAMLASRLGKSLTGLTLIVTLVLAFACASPSLLARPHLLALPLAIAWMVELLAARDAHRAPRLWMAAVMLVWANLHGGYLIGFVLMAPFALEALVEPEADRLKVLREWGLVGVLCAAATLATPHGLDGLTYPFQIMTMKTLNAITEWRSADFSSLTSFEIALLGALFVCLSRGVRVAPLRLVLLLALFHMALQHQRQEILFAVIAPLILAQPLGEALGQKAAAPGRPLMAWAAFGVLAACLIGLRLANPAVRADAVTTPLTALARVPSSLAAQPLLNSYGFGGYLIFKGVRPFIDGRSDMYGDDHFRRHLRIMAGDPKSLDQAIAQYHIAWSVLEPGEPLVQVLDSKPGWRRLYGDRYAIVHVRDDVSP